MKSNYGVGYSDQIAWSGLFPVGNAGKSQRGHMELATG